MIRNLALITLAAATATILLAGIWGLCTPINIVQRQNNVAFSRISCDRWRFSLVQARDVGPGSPSPPARAARMTNTTTIRSDLSLGTIAGDLVRNPSGRVDRSSEVPGASYVAMTLNDVTMLAWPSTTTMHWQSDNQGRLRQVALSELRIGLWLPLLLLGAYPVVAIIRGPGRRWWRHRIAARLGLCRECGYDLTGLTESRCPECGLAFAAHNTAAEMQTAPPVQGG